MPIIVRWNSTRNISIASAFRQGPQGPSRPSAPREGKCQWNGCNEMATHRAPMDRDHEGEYFQFCYDHVREYNKTLQLFLGPRRRIRSPGFHKDAITGHRPTWTHGVNRGAASMPLGGNDPRAAASARIRARISGAGGSRASPATRESCGPSTRRRSRISGCRIRPVQPTSSDATKSLSNAIIPMQMGAIAAPRTGCGRSFRPTSISRQAGFC